LLNSVFIYGHEREDQPIRKKKPQREKPAYALEAHQKVTKQLRPILGTPVDEKERVTPDTRGFVEEAGRACGIGSQEEIE